MKCKIDPHDQQSSKPSRKPNSIRFVLDTWRWKKWKKGYFLLHTVDISLKLVPKSHKKASTPYMVMGETKHHPTWYMNLTEVLCSVTGFYNCKLHIWPLLPEIVRFLNCTQLKRYLKLDWGTNGKLDHKMEHYWGWFAVLKNKLQCAEIWCFQAISMGCL